MRGEIENYYVGKIDREREAAERQGMGQPAEETVIKLHDSIPGMDSRLSNEEEDKGSEIGGRQTVDVITYYNGKPVMATQITTGTEKGLIKKKMEEMKLRPFIRLEEMSNKDTAIPKTLVYVDAKQVNTFMKDPDFDKHPEVALQIIDSHIKSLQFDITQTKNPQEQVAIRQLISLFEQERKKYIH